MRFMETEKIFRLFTLFMFLFLAFIGCERTASYPLPITPKNQLFENEYFAIYYPEGQSAIPHPLDKNELADVFFGNYQYRPYNFEISVSEVDHEEMNFIKRGRKTDILLYRNFNYDSVRDNLSKKDETVQLAGRTAYKGTLIGKKGEIYRETQMFIIPLSDNKIAMIYLSYWRDFGPEIRERLEEVLNSIRFKIQ